MFEHTQQHHDLFRIVLGSQGGLVVRKQVTKDVTALIKSHLVQHQSAEATIPLDIAANHLATLLFSLIEWWLENNMPYSPEQMGRIYGQHIVKPVLSLSGHYTQ
jgi:hypothetical protein